MFSNVEPLDSSKHQELRFTKGQNFSFAANISSVQLAHSEIRNAAKYYPIVFPSDGGCVPRALLSLKNDHNFYIDDQGNWKVPYVPMFFRMYPFTLSKVDKDQENYVLCIDRDAEHFMSGQGEPMFTADGETNDFIKRILNSLQKYHQEIKTTEKLFTEVMENELIVDKQLNMEIDKQKKKVGGFKGVDIEKLVSLDDNTLADFTRKGIAGLIHEHSHSLSNARFLAETLTG